MNTKKTSGSLKKSNRKSLKQKNNKLNPIAHNKLKKKAKYNDYKDKLKKGDPLPSFNDRDIRLNKYLSNAGVCSRRDADVLIKAGLVSVNGEQVFQMGLKVCPSDLVKYDGELINPEKKRYVLLNKPKGFITTMDDPFGRKTVMGLVKKACKERIYPVGRLDLESRGAMILTNHGELTMKLTHPRYMHDKTYKVWVSGNPSLNTLEKWRSGISLEGRRTMKAKVTLLK